MFVRPGGRIRGGLWRRRGVTGVEGASMCALEGGCGVGVVLWGRICGRGCKIVYTRPQIGFNREPLSAVNRLEGVFVQ